MYIYEALKVLAIVAAVSAVISVVFYCIAVWLVSRDTHIEPIVVSKDDYKRIQKENNLLLKEYVDGVKPAKQKIWCAK